MEEMKFYTEEEVLDKYIGPLGTPARDRYEANIQDFLVGAGNLSINAIRRAFKALGVQGGSLELGPLGKITLW